METRWEVSPGYAKGEKEMIAELSHDQKRQYEAARVENAVQRKYDFLTAVQAVTHDIPGVKSVQLETRAAIIDTRSKGADLFRFSGVHARTSWVAPATKTAYQGSVTYDTKAKS